MAGHSKRSPSRARAPRASWAEVERRIDVVLGIMSTGPGAWTKEAGQALANEWGVAFGTVEKVAAEASRRLRAGMGNVKRHQRRLVARLGLAYRMAERLGEPRTMVAAVAEEAKISGVLAPQKLALTDSNGDDLAPAYLAPYLGHPAVFAWLAAHPGSLPTEGELGELVKESTGSA